jgi:hypothetical protein
MSQTGFDFELLFTGLCVFTFQGDAKQPQAARVLLLSSGPSGHGRTAAAGDASGGRPRNGAGHAHGSGEHASGRGNAGGNGQGGQGGQSGQVVEHAPTLTYAAADLTVRSDKTGQRAFVGPDGALVAWRDLKDMMNMELVPPGGFVGPLTTTWRPDGVRRQVPRGPEEEVWLDWTLRTQRLLPDLPPGNGQPLEALVPKAVTARVELRHGTLRASHVARGLNGGYLLWNFEDEASRTFDRRESQAIAGAIVLRLEGLQAPVQIRGLGGFLELAPPVGSTRRLVQASITNFPAVPPEKEGDRLVHLTHSYAALLPSGARPIRKRFVTGFDHLDTPGNPLCPSAMHP